MSRFLHVVTPENIEVTYELAGIGSRFVAAVIDHAIQLAAILVITLLAWALGASSGAFGRFVEGQAPLYVDAIAGLVVFVIVFGYFIFFELLWAGRTPGKRVAGLRVVRDRGYPIDLYSSIARNLVRIVDFVPPFYGIGLTSVFFSTDYKRLGDYAGGTVVIKDRPPARLEQRAPGPPTASVEYYLPLIRNVDLITPEEYGAVHRFVQRRHELELPVQAHIAMRLALPLIQKLQLLVEVPTQLHYADLLEAIERKYVSERGVL